MKKVASKPKKHRKLIDLPVKLMADLTDLAKKDNRGLKNYIETQLIAIVLKENVKEQSKK